MGSVGEMHGELLRWVPPHVRSATGESSLLLVEVGRLIDSAVDQGATLLAFAPPLSVLAASTAGVLRAAREASSAVFLRVDLRATEGRGHAAAFEALCRACEVTQYDWPLGAAVDIEVSPGRLASGEVGREIGEALAAGFPSVLLRVQLPVDATALLEVLRPCADLELGCGLELVDGAVEPEGFLADLRSAGAPIAFLVGDRDLAAGAEIARWASGDELTRPSLLVEGPPVIELGLGLPESARGERAEALAYYAAETLLTAWGARGNGASLAKAVVRRRV